MSTITPHLWFDRQAREAAEFYGEVFPDSGLTSSSVIGDTPDGETEVVTFRVWGQDFMAISAGPRFTITPAISFIVNFEQDADLLDQVWARLTDGGTVMMDVGEYPFSRRYGWVADRFGVSWQLMVTNPEGDPRPRITPALTFVNDVSGQAEEATDAYIKIFGDAERGTIARYPEGVERSEPGTIMYSDFRLGDSWLAAMDGGRGHQWGFNEAVSLVVSCADQAEIDHPWDALSAVPEAEACGWCKDRWGVSWQIIPAEFGELMGSGTPEQSQRVVAAFMQMKKFDIAALRAAYDG
ncbi:MAG: VOC family protein [Jatrophihabitans sp.]|uniref:VOC family protein n=1 Tax=Jatrophihabitans sp. TaxID=1932789 RepID=UPI003F7F4AF5